MSDRFIDWLFDTLISVDVQHQELLRGFGVLLLIPFALFLCRTCGCPLPS